MPKGPVPDASHAVVVAWRRHLLDYRSDEHALRALKRRCPGLGIEAPKLLTLAGEVLATAIDLVEDELTTCRKYPHMPGGYTSSPQLVQSRKRLAERYPSFPKVARDDALEFAFVYNVL